MKHKNHTQHRYQTTQVHVNLTLIQTKNDLILPCQVEDCYQFASQYFSIFEALGVEDDFSNELIVWPAHGHRPEQLL